jgi:hypothetical protein
MDEVTRLRELEAECRRRARNEPDKKWYWLAQAAKYQVQANRKIAFHSEECNTADFPEVQLAQWRHGRDERRLMEPLPRAGPTGDGHASGMGRAACPPWPFGEFDEAVQNDRAALLLLPGAVLTI